MRSIWARAAPAVTTGPSRTTMRCATSGRQAERRWSSQQDAGGWSAARPSGDPLRPGAGRIAASRPPRAPWAPNPVDDAPCPAARRPTGDTLPSQAPVAALLLQAGMVESQAGDDHQGTLRNPLTSRSGQESEGRWTGLPAAVPVTFRAGRALGSRGEWLAARGRSRVTATLDARASRDRDGEIGMSVLALRMSIGRSHRDPIGVANANHAFIGVGRICPRNLCLCQRTGGRLPADRWRLDLQLIVSRIGRLAASTRRARRLAVLAQDLIRPTRACRLRTMRHSLEHRPLLLRMAPPARLRTYTGSRSA